MSSTAHSLFFGVCHDLGEHEQGVWSPLQIIDHMAADEVEKDARVRLLALVRPQGLSSLTVQLMLPDHRGQFVVEDGRAVDASSGDTYTASWGIALSRSALQWDGGYAFWLIADGEPISWHVLRVGVPIEGNCTIPLPRNLMARCHRHVSCFVPCEEATQDETGAWTIRSLYNSLYAERLPLAIEPLNVFVRGAFRDETKCRVQVTGPDERVVADSSSWTSRDIATHQVQLEGMRFATPGTYLFDLLCDGEIAATYPLRVAVGSR